MQSNDVRRQFVDFFKAKAHRFVPAAPVVPTDDPTLMFTNAGMNQYKDIFLGSNPKGLKRAVNSQPCIRVSGKHNDLEDVGYDGTHQTLFEMLGNWSFGDYYKRESIQWAWEFLTEVVGIPKAQMYATVYETDDESFELWKDVTDINPDHILRFGKKDNFWEMGEVGPCGPCSEIHVDLEGGASLELATDPVLGVNGENQRFIEFWNLVFIQYDRQADGSLKDLAETHVDTGMGLERLTAYMQGVRSNYETDLFRPVLDLISEASGRLYSSGDDGVAHRVMADHVRTVIFSIADNVMPSNEGRGYVLRRLLRRALRYATQIGFDSPILYRLVRPVVEKMGDFYPHIAEREDFITQVIESEEATFLRTLDSGEGRFQDLLSTMKAKGETEISGEEAFKLYDTYGFPLDLTALMAREHGLTVDEAGFDQALDEQQTRSRASAKKAVYEVADDGDVNLDALAESMPDLFHSPNQNAAKGGEARVLRDYGDKMAMARHHTATHLMHEALRRVLGEHVHQAGSLVDTDRLRFDFTHFKSLSRDELAKVEAIVNDEIEKSIPLTIDWMDLDSAKAKGAMALFGEKYDADNVRVVGIGEFSTELCGGTHVGNTSMIEAFKIVEESAISSGTRRIEAIAGRDVVNAFEADRLSELRQRVQTKLDKYTALLVEAQALDAGVSDTLGLSSLDALAFEALLDAEQGLIDASKQMDKTLQRLKKASAQSDAAVTDDDFQSLGGYRVFARRFSYDIGTLRSLADDLLASRADGIVILAGESSGKGVFVIKLGSSVDTNSISAKQIADVLTGVAGGGGGGRPNMVQAGGADLAKVDAALEAVTSAFPLSE